MTEWDESCLFCYYNDIILRAWVDVEYGCLAAEGFVWGSYIVIFSGFIVFMKIYIHLF